MVEWLQPSGMAPEHGEIARQAGMAVIITHPCLIRTYDFSMRKRKGLLRKVSPTGRAASPAESGSESCTAAVFSAKLLLRI